MPRHDFNGRSLSGTNRLDVAKRNLEDSLKLELLLLGSVKQYCEFGGENLKSVYQSVGIESAAVATGVDRRLPAGSKYTPVVASTKITPAAAYENARRKLVQVGVTLPTNHDSTRVFSQLRQRRRLALQLPPRVCANQGACRR